MSTAPRVFLTRGLSLLCRWFIRSAVYLHECRLTDGDVLLSYNPMRLDWSCSGFGGLQPGSLCCPPLSLCCPPLSPIVLSLLIFTFSPRPCRKLQALPCPSCPRISRSPEKSRPLARDGMRRRPGRPQARHSRGTRASRPCPPTEPESCAPRAVCCPRSDGCFCLDGPNGTVYDASNPDPSSHGPVSAPPTHLSLPLRR